MVSVSFLSLQGHIQFTSNCRKETFRLIELDSYVFSIFILEYIHGLVYSHLDLQSWIIWLTKFIATQSFMLLVGMKYTHVYIYFTPEELGILRQEIVILFMLQFLLVHVFLCEIIVVGNLFGF